MVVEMSPDDPFKHDPFKRESVFPDSLYAQGKSEYVTGHRPKVDCLLCAIRDGNPDVLTHKLYQDHVVFVILNLYPFNPGHLMVMPCRHVEKFRDLTDSEHAKITEFIKKCQALLEKEFGTTSFNIGINEGQFSGASIPHLHFQIIPRFKSELGFIDVIGKTRAVIYTLEQVHEKLKGKLH
jgi:diadenosine tetraphosphate (Ap4A) HIT family hydrolase